MSEFVNVCMPKIMQTQIKLGVRMYAIYANCRTLSMAGSHFLVQFKGEGLHFCLKRHPSWVFSIKSLAI